MGTTAIIAGVLSLLASIGGFAGKKINEKNSREMSNDMAHVDNSANGVSIASDITGMAAQALSAFSGFGVSPNKPNSTQAFNEGAKRLFSSRNRLFV